MRKTGNGGRAIQIVVIIGLIGLLAGPVWAKKDANPRRIVGGHHFTPSTVTEFPILVTRVGTFIGAGYFNAKVSDNSGQELTLRAAALALAIGSDIAFTDWIGLRLGFASSVIAGINTTTAINLGALLNLDVNAGPVFRFFKAGPFQMVGGVDVGFQLGNQISPATLLNAAGGTGGVLIQTKALDVRPYVAYALGLTSIFGLQGSVAYTFARDFSSKTNGHQVDVGLALSLDFYAVGLQVGYGYNRDIEAKSNAHNIEAGIFYTGRGDLTLGFAATFQIPRNKQLIVVGQFAMIYYW